MNEETNGSEAFLLDLKGVFERHGLAIMSKERAERLIALARLAIIAEDADPDNQDEFDAHFDAHSDAVNCLSDSDLLGVDGGQWTDEAYNALKEENIRAWRIAEDVKARLDG